MTSRNTGLPHGGISDQAFGLWPPHFPHVEIDALFDKLESESLGRDELERLLVLVGREARRLRTTVTRLTAARLLAAQEEASSIVAAARERADALAPPTPAKSSKAATGKKSTKSGVRP